MQILRDRITPDHLDVCVTVDIMTSHAQLVAVGRYSLGGGRCIVGRMTRSAAMTVVAEQVFKTGIGVREAGSDLAKQHVVVFADIIPVLRAVSCMTGFARTVSWGISIQAVKPRYIVIATGKRTVVTCITHH